MIAISEVHAREVLDSRGNPTVEVDVLLSDGSSGRSAVPSGASTGANEALELRDGDPTRFRGLGVLDAVSNVRNRIAPAVIGHRPLDQQNIDRLLNELDGTSDKSLLGANAVLAVSMAVARALARSQKKPLYTCLSDGSSMTLPVPMFNVINGGRHAEGSTDFQEFMVVPAGFDTFNEALRAGVDVYRALQDLLRSRKASTTVGDEGGFAPSLHSNREAMELTLSSIESAGYLPGVQCFIALDVAASELVLDDGRYSMLREGKILHRAELIDKYKRWIANYPVISIEDGIAEEDWVGWRLMTQDFGDSVQLVGDDLYATNTDLIRKGIESNASNAVLIKANQIGTLTETLNAIQISREANWNVIISHRSGETTDDFISDLAVATAAGQIKAGAPARGERIAKYNRLLRIEEELGSSAVFAGKASYERFIGLR